MSKKRKLNDIYVQFGFTCTETNEALQKLQCMFCNIVFSNTNLKPSKLQEPLNNRHCGADVSGHDVESLKANRIQFESQGTLPKLGFVSADKPILMALYHVTSKSKKPYTIAEDLIKLSVLQITKTVSKLQKSLN